MLELNGTFRNVSLLLSHACPYAVRFDAYATNHTIRCRHSLTRVVLGVWYSTRVNAIGDASVSIFRSVPFNAPSFSDGSPRS